MKENLKGLCLGDQIELLHVAGLNLMDGKWSFCDEDPQIYLKFRRPIRGMIIPGLFEPPVRTLRATVPENESHIFRQFRATLGSIT